MDNVEEYRKSFVDYFALNRDSKFIYEKVETNNYSWTVK